MTRRLAAALGLVAVLLASACSPASRFDDDADGVTTVTFRLWDRQVAAAYERSFAAFSRANPDIRVELVQVPFADYFTSLPLDVASGTATDVYWVNAQYFGAFADAGRLIDVGSALADQRAGWAAPAVEQYTRAGTLWGVPAVTDGRIALFYHRDMVREAGVDPAALRWDPTDPAADTLLPAARRLTRDAAGRSPGQPGFDPGAVRRYGYNAARDLQAIFYNFVGSNGARFQAPDGTFDFATPAGEQAFGYLVDMIDRERVAPSAADTGQNPDFSRDAFLQGRMALFQSGTYNLANLTEAPFAWGVAPLPAGPAGRVSVVNSIVAAGNADSPKRPEILRVLRWLGSPEGAAPVGDSGAGLPAVTAAQRGWFAYWAARGVDTRPFVEDGPTIPAPSGPKYGAALTAMEPTLDEVFAGRLPVGPGLRSAQDVGNAALR
ncbi:ABC transporter substrate-binding protein [Pseudonocardia spirodelae]|uniref:Sugar ABC transporter substrate-binding protein n=1 Tax=Pseudonocardia spirodelae TaxID=3133431 RepID=A0ABU8TCC5_9PSEU